MADKEMCDCCYNVHKQLTKKAEFLWHAEKYLEDAKKENHQQCAEVLEEIVEDERKHVRLLKKLCENGIC